MNSLLSSILFTINNEKRTEQITLQKKQNEELNKIPKSLEQKLKINTHIHKKDRLNFKINTKSQEHRIRKIMQNYFQVPFNKVRPNFLKNPKTGRNLELDLYSPELNISVEVQGAQHMEFLPHFHKSYSDFENQKYRDHLKYIKCKEHNIRLIIVYYYEISETMLDTEVLDLILNKLNDVL